MEPEAEEEAAEGGKLSVWVCREEKLVSGVSKRTTCADVVRVLLQDQSSQQGQGQQQRGQRSGCASTTSMLSGSPQSYCVVEKWRGFERLLPNKTKILRLWSAWGDEQENVRFVLVKNDASLPNNGPRSAEARVVQSKESSGSGGGTGGGTGTPRTPLHHAGAGGVAAAAGVLLLKPGANLSQQQDKQRRVVRKAFRKLDKMKNKKRGEETTALRGDHGVCMEKMETLVHLVISQDHTIRQQVHRVKELDREIERHEATVHFDRIKRHGVNYVQDTYMVETGADTHTHTLADWTKRRATPTSTSTTCTTTSITSTTTTAEALAQFEEYARRCEKMVRLEEELTERQALVESVTEQLQEELNQRWMKRRREVSASAGRGEAEGVSAITTTTTTTQLPGDGDVESLSDNELALEEERIKTQLDTSLYIGLRLNTDLEAIKGDLNLSRETWEAKERELLDLLATVETLEGDAAGGVVVVMLEAQVCSSPAPVVEKSGGGGWVDQVRGLSNTCHMNNDDDSDTGLSSMHSQDSDNPPTCESLV